VGLAVGGVALVVGGVGLVAATGPANAARLGRVAGILILLGLVALGVALIGRL
jgi:hypothetical protein